MKWQNKVIDIFQSDINNFSWNLSVANTCFLAIFDSFGWVTTVTRKWAFLQDNIHSHKSQLVQLAANYSNFEIVPTPIIYSRFDSIIFFLMRPYSEPYWFETNDTLAQLGIQSTTAAFRWGLSLVGLTIPLDYLCPVSPR